MSHTSIDTGGGRRFRITFGVTAAALTLLCALFLGLGYLQGPKLSSAQVDTSGVVTQGNQQLRLFANQDVAQVRAEQVTVSPSADVSVTTTDDVISVQFDERLDYGTEYTVRVEGVSSVYLSQSSTIEYSFITDSPTMLFLDRADPASGSSAADQIISTGLSGADRSVMYSGTRIQDFRQLLNSLAVVSLADDDSSMLELVSIRDGVTEQVRLPGAVTIRDLDAASSGTVIGFTLTSTADGADPAEANTLYTLDLDSGRSVEAVVGIDGQPLRVLGWQFIPGTSTLLALSTDKSLVLVDTVDRAVTPLGQFSEFGRISGDGSIITMVDTAGAVALTIADGSQERLVASPVLGEAGFLGETAVLANGDRIEKVVVPDESGTRFASLLVYDDGTESRVIYQTPEGKGSITGFTVSPNDQYVGIDVVLDNSSSESDGYAVDARSTTATTIIVDIASGAQVRSFEGFALEW